MNMPLICIDYMLLGNLWRLFCFVAANAREYVLSWEKKTQHALLCNSVLSQYALLCYSVLSQYALLFYSVLSQDVLLCYSVLALYVLLRYSVLD